MEMNHQEWQRPVPMDEAHRRASGRRAYNIRRQIQAELRRQQVVTLLRQGQRTYTAMAQALGVSRWTISRDVQVLLAQGPLLRPYRR